MSNENGESDVTPTESETTRTVGNLSHGSRETPVTSTSPVGSLFAGEVSRSPKPDEWAKLEVTMKGHEITAKINGVFVGKAEDPTLEFPTGRVAFAVMPDSVLSLRNVRVRELTSELPPEIKAP